MDNMNIVMTIIFLFTFIPLVIAEIARKKSKTTAGDFFLCERKAFLTVGICDRVCDLGKFVCRYRGKQHVL